MKDWNVTNDVWTLQNIKDLYYSELALGLIDRGFDEYLRDNFIPAYNDEFDFIGYERK